MNKEYTEVTKSLVNNYRGIRDLIGSKYVRYTAGIVMAASAITFIVGVTGAANRSSKLELQYEAKNEVRPAMQLTNPKTIEEKFAREENLKEKYATIAGWSGGGLVLSGVVLGTSFLMRRKD